MPFSRGYDLSDLNDPDNKGLRFVFTNTPKLDMSPMTTRGLAEMHLEAYSACVDAHEQVKTDAVNGVDIDTLSKDVEAYMSAYNHAEYIHNAYNARLVDPYKFPSFGVWFTKMLKPL